MSSTSKTNNAIDELYAEELGTLVFQAALLQYLADLPESKATDFETYVNENISKDDFLKELCSLYPDFEQTLKSEMSVLQHELSLVTKTTD